MIQVRAYTDGACSGNPGPGGWGVVLQAWRDGELIRNLELSGRALETTNNQMELEAACQALEALNRWSRIRIHTDSRYVCDGISKWILGWKARNWKTKAGQPVKNIELWQRLDRLCQLHSVEWKWVKGHAGNVGNEIADRLACEARDMAVTTVARTEIYDLTEQE